jgi:hypothetical protein
MTRFHYTSLTGGCLTKQINIQNKLPINHLLKIEIDRRTIDGWVKRNIMFGRYYLIDSEYFPSPMIIPASCYILEENLIIMEAHQVIWLLKQNLNLVKLKPKEPLKDSKK